MVSATSSRVRSLLHFCELQHRIEAELAQRPIPLLVLRFPDFARIAWLRGRPAARQAERRTVRSIAKAVRPILRRDDSLAHDSGSDLFAVALASPRNNCRSLTRVSGVARERIAAEFAQATGLKIETGCTMVERLDATLNVRAYLDDAITRGAREREQFLAVVGHELRTPLTSMRGYLETLIEGELGLAKRRRFLGVLHRETLRLTRLVDAMAGSAGLDFLSNGVAFAECDLGEQVRRVCELLRPQARKRGVTIECKSLANVRVSVDADECEQILLNILQNALTHGRDRGLVRVECRYTAKRACVIIDDDGLGIARTERRTIFGWRRRGVASQPGCGIGLAVVKALVERAGGQAIAGESPLGGARFEVWLPLGAESRTTAS